jgi:hypothetical protein
MAESARIDRDKSTRPGMSRLAGLVVAVFATGIGMFGMVRACAVRRRPLGGFTLAAVPAAAFTPPPRQLPPRLLERKT